MILHGDCLDVLKTLPANSVHMVVTSPPYWSLRDYSVPPTIWDGNPLCAHAWTSETYAEGFSGKRKWQHSVNGRGDGNDALTNATMPSGSSRRGLTTITRKSEPGVWAHVSQGQFCTGCGAWRGCLGLEPTIDLYVEHIVQVFREVRRVLRKDGTCWLNIGDSYANDTKWGGSTSGKHVKALHGETKIGRGRRRTGLQAKDLCLVPFRVALALQADGWVVRNDAIWSKTNPMPESAKDRLTKSHEYLFLLAKSESYFFDGDAIRERVAGTSHSRGTGKHPKAVTRVGRGTGVKQNTSFGEAVREIVGSRNCRSVWTFPTSPYKGAHFATFPTKLVEPCILAGTSAHGCCSLCGAPYRRVVKLGEPCVAQMKTAGANADGSYHGKATKDFAGARAQDASATKARILAGMRERLTVGWVPTCKHGLGEVVPCVVLDPFGGAGTTALVAERLGRDSLLIELGAQNVAMAEERLCRKPVEVPA